MNFLNKSNIIFLCVFILIYLVTHGFVNSNSMIGYYKSSLIPEFTGIFLELLIILIVFNKWQERLENQSKIDKERILRKYIIFTINKLKNSNSIPNVFSFYGENHNENHTVLNNLRNEIKCLSEKQVTEKFSDVMIRHCQMDIDAITALLPVAADLSKEHFKAWSRMVFYVKTLSLFDDNINEKEFKYAVAKLIEYIKEFDDATFKNKIYVCSRAI